MASCPKCGNRKVKKKGYKYCTRCGPWPNVSRETSQKARGVTLMEAGEVAITILVIVWTVASLLIGGGRSWQDM